MWLSGTGKVNMRAESEFDLASATVMNETRFMLNFGVILGVRTCDIFLCLLPISICFIALVVSGLFLSLLRHSCVSQVLTLRMVWAEFLCMSLPGFSKDESGRSPRAILFCKELKIIYVNYLENMGQCPAFNYIM